MDTWNAVLTTLARQFCQKGTDSSLGVQKRCGNLQFVLNKIVSSRKSCRHAECNVANADESFSSSWRWGTHGVQQCWIVRIFLSKRRFSENVSPDTHFQVSTNLPFFFSQSDKRFRSKSVMLESIFFIVHFLKCYSGRIKCCFDDPVGKTSTKGSKIIRQTPKTIKQIIIFAKRYSSSK